jgi:hypothetical protein
MKLFRDHQIDIKFVFGSSVFTLLVASVGYIAYRIAQSMCSII